MIQRIQSIFLFLVAAGFLSLFFVPLGSSSEGFGSIYENRTLDLQDHIGLLILAIVGGLLSLGSIFLFKNRKLQVTMSSICAMLALPIIGLSYWLHTNNPAPEIDITTSYGLGFFLTISSFILSIVAITFIKKDDKLVKSMDRLR